MISHKNLLVFLLATILFPLFSSCWEKNYDHIYQIRFSNATTDTIVILLHNSECFVQPDDIASSIILPGDTMNLHAIKINEPKNPIEEFVNQSFINEVGVYLLDDTIQKYSQLEFDGHICPLDSSLRKTWFGPIQELPDSVHSIFNRNSWEIIDSTDNWGVIIFTIYQSDLE